LFVQGRPILSTMMKRNKIKGVKNLKAKAEAEEEEKAKEDNSKKEEENKETPEDEAAV